MNSHLQLLKISKKNIQQSCNLRTFNNKESEVTSVVTYQTPKIVESKKEHSHLRRRLDKYEDSFNSSLVKELDRFEKRLNKRIDDMESRLIKKLDGFEIGITKKLDSLETKFDNLESGITKKLDSLETKFDNLESGITKKLDSLETKLDKYFKRLKYESYFQSTLLLLITVMILMIDSQNKSNRAASEKEINETLERILDRLKSLNEK
ncbi:hypothetical protein ACQ4LE_009092 [Meloidogyne hapla]